MDRMAYRGRIMESLQHAEPDRSARGREEGGYTGMVQGGFDDG